MTVQTHDFLNIGPINSNGSAGMCHKTSQKQQVSEQQVGLLSSGRWEIERSNGRWVLNTEIGSWELSWMLTVCIFAGLLVLRCPGTWGINVSLYVSSIAVETPGDLKVSTYRLAMHESQAQFRAVNGTPEVADDWETSLAEWQSECIYFLDSFIFLENACF